MSKKKDMTVSKFLALMGILFLVMAIVVIVSVFVSRWQWSGLNNGKRLLKAEIYYQPYKYAAAQGYGV